MGEPKIFRIRVRVLTEGEQEVLIIAGDEAEARKRAIADARKLLNWSMYAANAEVETYAKEVVELEPPSWKPKKR